MLQRTIVFILVFTVIGNAFAERGVPPNSEDKITHMLVIALIGEYKVRKEIEEEVKYQLAFAGVKSSTSYNTKLFKELSKESVIEYCNTVGADGVVFMDLLNVRAPTEYERKESKAKVTVYTWGGFSYRTGPYTAGANTKVKIQASVLTVPEGKKLHQQMQTLHIGLENEKAIEKSVGKVVKAIMKIPQVEKKPVDK